MKTELEVFLVKTGVTGAAEAAAHYLVNGFAEPVEVEAISFMPNQNLTANDTNYRTFTATNGGTALFTGVTTQTTGSGNLTAGTALDFTLLTTAAARTARRVAAGGSLLLNAAVTASGVAIDGSWIIKARRVRAQ